MSNNNHNNNKITYLEKLKNVCSDRVKQKKKQKFFASKSLLRKIIIIINLHNVFD